MEHFFPPNSSEHLRSDAHQSQIIGGDADVKHNQTIGGYSQIIGGNVSPHPPRVSAPLFSMFKSDSKQFFLTLTN